MKKKLIFRGAATALITPFNENGIDFESFAKIIEFQIAGGADALVVCGTTGEASTMPDEEHISAIEFVCRQAGGRVPVIAGTGSNDTPHALKLTRAACESGADALLVVTPYYNKTSQSGLVKLFERIADASSAPIILYNVPSRTGVNIEPQTYAALAEHENIVAFKEANSNISKIVETMALVGDRLTLYCGNDDQITPLLALGGEGVISVLSNLLPAETSRICKLFFRGDAAGSAALQYKYMPLIKALFSDVNPIPIKEAMAEAGFCKPILREPLVPLSDLTRAELLKQLKIFGII